VPERLGAKQALQKGCTAADGIFFVVLVDANNRTSQRQAASSTATDWWAIMIMHVQNVMI
jgi:hypothetical protein